MRIVRYHPRAVIGDGGMTTAIRRQSEVAAELGHEITVAFDEGDMPPVVNAVHWQHVPHRGTGSLRLAVGLEMALRNTDVLVLHSAWTPHNARAAAAARAAGVPYILEPRGAYDPHILRRRRALKKTWWHAVERNVVERARAMHLFFEDERPHVEAIGYRGPFVISPNGIDPPPGVSWDGGSGGYILWLGRFDPEHKGLDLLVDAIARLLPSERPHLVMQGPDFRGGKSAVAKRIDDLGLAKWIELRAPVYGDEKLSAIARARGFVYPSRWEGFGNSLAEAAAIGVPSLVTPYPFGRALASRGAAILAEATPDALAEGLRALSSERARSTGEAASAVVRETFSWPAVTASWLRQVWELL